MRLAVLGVALALAAQPAFAQAPLAGPDGTSLDKVLVIGTDGTRWDLLQSAIKAGRAPNLARLSKQGFGRPSLLHYGPNTLTLSEVGWCSIASGVWEDKHGVDGGKLNEDPEPLVVDNLPTVLHQLGLATPRSWKIDGRSLSRAKPPSSTSAKLHGDRLVANLRLGSRPRGIRRAIFHLPSAARGAAQVRVNGEAGRSVTAGRTVDVALGRGGLRAISLAVRLRGTGGGSLVVVLPGRAKLAIPIS
jgi:hypothetical protein